MKVVASMMAGAKERIMVLQVGDEQHLIGVTTHSINHLSTLEKPLQPTKTSLAPGQSGAFKDKLVEAMASRMKGSSVAQQGARKDD